MQKSIIFLILLLFPVTTLPQIISEEVIAKVGNNEITEQEFLARYELTPQVTAGIKGMETFKERSIVFHHFRKTLGT